MDGQVNLREVSDKHLPVSKRPVHRGFRDAQGDVEMFGGIRCHTWIFFPMRHTLPDTWHLSGRDMPYISCFPRREIFGSIWFVLAKHALYQMKVPLLGCQNGT